MKKIVTVEDRPWLWQDCIKQFQEEGIEFCETVFYPGNFLEENIQEQYIEDYKKVTGVKVRQVNSQMEFLNIMDELYKNPDIVFLMDYDLKGDMSREDFFSRINVRYALKKDTEKKIWFYTTGFADIVGALHDTFPERVLSVLCPPDGQYFWDEKQVRKAVE